MQQQGKIIFISGPSGAGKGTLIEKLREKHATWVFPPSCTTREMRSGEKNGETYFFISREAFLKKIKAGEFLEYAEVHNGNLYGTLKQPLFDGISQGKIVVREFDIQGFEQARKILPKDLFVSIFLTVHGGKEELIRRIHHRGLMSDDELQRRMGSVDRELAAESLYDFVVYNDEIPQMVREVEKIIAQSFSPLLEYFS